VASTDVIHLTKTFNKSKKCWIDPQTGKETAIEGAVSGYFRQRGFHVPYNEAIGKQIGGDSGFYWCILNSCLLAVMFENYDHRNPLHKNVFEDIFTGLRLRRFAMPSVRNPVTGKVTEMARIDDHEAAVAGAAQRSVDDIERNLKAIVPKYLSKYKVPRTCFGEDLTPSRMVKSILPVFESLGLEMLLALQVYRSEKNFAVEGRGWPDLAVWNSKDFAFVEVKGPNDRLQAHQRARLEEINALGISAYTLNVKSA